MTDMDAAPVDRRSIKILIEDVEDLEPHLYRQNRPAEDVDRIKRDARGVDGLNGVREWEELSRDELLRAEKVYLNVITSNAPPPASVKSNVVKLRQTVKAPTSSEAVAPDNSGGLVVLDMENVKVRNVDFIWEGRLARGKHTALAGEAGEGKSQIMCDLFARISRGGYWPDEKRKGDGGKAPQGYCVILSAEDDPDDTLGPRLIAAGADMKYIKFVQMVADGAGKTRKFNLQADLQRLKAYCKSLGNVVAIGIDPVSSYMGGEIDAKSNTSVRHVLDPLSDLAVELQCAILSITHFRKGSGGPKAVHRVMDSVAFAAAPRASFAVYPDPTDIGSDFLGLVRLLLLLKTNLPGARPLGLKYRIEEVIGGDGLMDTRGEKAVPIKTSRVVWMGTTELSADTVSQMEGDRIAPKLDEAADFLRGTLDDGPKPAANVKAEAKEKGISEVTLLRAKRQLGVIATTTGAGQPWDWSLPT